MKFSNLQDELRYLKFSFRQLKIYFPELARSRSEEYHNKRRYLEHCIKAVKRPTTRESSADEQITERNAFASYRPQRTP